MEKTMAKKRMTKKERMRQRRRRQRMMFGGGLLLVAVVFTVILLLLGSKGCGTSKAEGDEVEAVPSADALLRRRLPNRHRRQSRYHRSTSAISTVGPGFW